MSKLTYKMAQYLRFLIEAKDWSETSGVLYGHPLQNVVDERKNGMSVYLDTRSPHALSYEDASKMIEILKGLEFRTSKEDFKAEKDAKIAEFKAAKAEVKAEVLADVPADGAIYAVVGANFKVQAKADTLGRIRLTVA